MIRLVRFFFIGTILLIVGRGLCLDEVWADESSGAVCSGFRPAEGSFIPPGEYHDNEPLAFEERCPEGYGVFAAMPHGGVYYEPDQLNYRLSCCPLPLKDLLTSETVYTDSICPPQHVVIGLRHTRKLKDGPRRQELLCAHVNERRYQLAAPRAGRHFGLAVHFRSTFEELYSRSQLPAALRYGLGRRSRYSYYPKICVGDPAGSLLVGKQGKVCSQTLFSEVKQAGKQLHLYPRCVAVEKPYSEAPGCVCSGAACKRKGKAE